MGSRPMKRKKKMHRMIICYNGDSEDPAITNIFFGTVALRYSGVPLYFPSASLNERKKVKSSEKAFISIEHLLELPF